MLGKYFILLARIRMVIILSLGDAAGRMLFQIVIMNTDYEISISSQELMGGVRSGPGSEYGTPIATPR